ncbi:hypothetical protein, partial [Pseudomonas aeruginosa]|uniref:hypothetical protein n=1 Tax=Pseudomonas aeruginosa TaxID=287 RepID=UPI0039691EDB
NNPITSYPPSAAFLHGLGQKQTLTTDGSSPAANTEDFSLRAYLNGISLGFLWLLWQLICVLV